MSSIYKYAVYRPEFFENFYLKLSCFGDFNDPFEMVMGNYFLSMSEEEAEEIMSYSNNLNDPTSYNDAALDAKCGVRASIGVICFTAKPDNLLMWAHYANNHSGICIEFDSSAIHFNGKFKDASICEFTGNTIKDHYKNIGILKKVEYQLERLSYIEPQEFESNTSSWFVKSPEWKYEEEQRMLISLDSAIRDSNNNMYFFEMEPTIIKSVILGCQMQASVKSEIFKKCQKLGIKVKEVFIHAHQFKLDIVDYSPENHRKYFNEYNLNRITHY
ncbi:MAG: DUF2971 domain-containing protein [Campylobacterales bacterium]|nr:DUF2971 domain-containing protein [Campylobacterales bacterium]